jgi:hypothetical protein
MSRLMLLSSLLVLGVGCASTGSASRADGPALPLGQPAGEPLLIQGSAITGPTSSLVVTDDAMRGRFRDMPVSLKWNYQQLTGAVGNWGTYLELAEGDDTRVSGIFGGSQVDFIVEKDWLHGHVGGCGYILQRNETGYSGRRSCGGPLEADLQVAFPAQLMERPLGERAALMTLMLVNTTSTYSPSVSLARFARPPSVTKGSDPYQP